MLLKLILLLILIKNQQLEPPEKAVNINLDTSKINNNININNIIKSDKEAPIGYIKIPKINLNNEIYNINSKHNNIEENVTILKSSKSIKTKDSLIILAAHSGSGKIAYFNNLNKLNINDTIELKYYDENYIFTVTNIYEQDKVGYIKISKKDESQLILTTCSTTTNNKQLIIESTLKES